MKGTQFLWHPESVIVTFHETKTLTIGSGVKHLFADLPLDTGNGILGEALSLIIREVPQIVDSDVDSREDLSVEYDDEKEDL